MAGLCAPLSTLRQYPHGYLRMTRGRCGSLLLHRDGLAPSTPCRSPGALRSTPINGHRHTGPVGPFRAQERPSDLETPDSACARFAFLLWGLGRFDLGEAPSLPVTVECWRDGAKSRKW